MAEKYQVVVIGSGPGGYVAALRATQLGLKTACIEKDPTLGGTCLNVGCIPSKALLQSTELYARLMTEGEIHGIESSNIEMNFNTLMKRKEKIVKELVESIAHLFKGRNVTRLTGTALIKSPNEIEITNGKEKSTIEADYIIIATGSEPIPLPQLPFDEERIVSSTGAIALKEVPKSMIVVGAGAIGLELASVYRRLGSEVTVVEMLDHISPAMDKAIGKVLLQIMKKQGLNFHLSTEVTKAKVVDKQVSVVLNQGAQAILMTVDIMLVAVGRRPFTKSLGLKEVGIQLNPKGFINVDGSFRTSVPNIFAIGDVIDGPMLAHKASEEGIAVAEIIAGGHPQVNYLAIPNVIYTAPEVASVGMTEQEARNAGLEIIIGTSAFKGNPRARCNGETDGLVKVIGEARSRRLIGMHIIGQYASEIIAEGVMAISCKATLDQIADTSHAHPTLAEAIKEAALMAVGKPLHG